MMVPRSIAEAPVISKDLAFYVGSPADAEYTHRSQRSSLHQQDRSQSSSSSALQEQARPGVHSHEVASFVDLPSLGSETRQSSPVMPSIYQLIRAEAFDEAVVEKLIDDEAMSVLTLLFKTSEVSTAIPAPNGWAFDWDVSKNRLNDELLLVVLSDSQRIGADRIVDER